MSKRTISGKSAIVGIGATEFSKRSGRSEMRLAVEAVLAACADAGIDPSEVDGISTYTMDNNPEMEVHRLIGGKALKMFSRIDYGGGAACGPLLQAAMAVATGICECVVVYRAMNERSEYRFGTGVADRGADPTYETAAFGWHSPHGLITPASWVAMSASAYLHKYGATTEDFGRVSVGGRAMAAENPNAWFYQQPITLEDHQNSRWICEPLRLLDCCQESDGAVACVVVSDERAKELNHKPAYIRGAAQGACDDQQSMTSYYREDITRLTECSLVADQLYRQAGIGPSDIQTAVIYDHFTPYVMTQLEEYGFCQRGEAKDFLRSGEHLLTGSLPINTHGGQLGEAYIHGMNGVAEGVRQIRGQSVNQVDNVQHVLVTAGTGVPTSGLLLGSEN
jgi:acetyl-CoA acetyltransferase